MSIWNFCLGGWIGLKQIFGWWSINKLSTLARLKKNLPMRGISKYPTAYGWITQGPLWFNHVPLSNQWWVDICCCFYPISRLLVSTQKFIATNTCNIKTCSNPRKYTRTNDIYIDIQQSYPIRSMNPISSYKYIYMICIYTLFGCSLTIDLGKCTSPAAMGMPMGLHRSLECSVKQIN